MLSNINDAYIEYFDIQNTPKGTKRNYWLKLISDGFSNPICIPVIVIRGINDGPILGITAAVHGNELNGISVIQRLINEVEPTELSGAIIAVPVVNVPAYTRRKRRFNDGVDLNHIMPGKENGNISQVYAYRFFNKMVKHFDYLLDLHTASQGRINSFYLRADMDQQIVKDFALLQNAEIIVHNPPSDGTLRGAAAEEKIPAITLEVGNPNIFQKSMVKSGVLGIHNTLCHLKMINEEITLPDIKAELCKRSYWLFTDAGGLLTVKVNLRDIVHKGQIVAILRDIFGRIVKEYTAPERGIVIGKSISPVNQTGGRILHLGIMDEL